MSESKYECRLARDSDFRDVLRIGLAEAFTGLEEALHDLNDAQALAFPLPGRPNIASIVAHLLQNASTFALAAQGAERVFPGEDRWSFHELPSGRMPKPGDKFPTPAELRAILAETRSAVLGHLAASDEQDLLRPRAPAEWNQQGNSTDLYVRVIEHHAAHLRQIWLLRGAMGLTTWPAQHWA